MNGHLPPPYQKALDLLRLKDMTTPGHYVAVHNDDGSVDIRNDFIDPPITVWSSSNASPHDADYAAAALNDTVIVANGIGMLASSVSILAGAINKHAPEVEAMIECAMAEEGVTENEHGALKSFLKVMREVGKLG